MDVAPSGGRALALRGEEKKAGDGTAVRKHRRAIGASVSPNLRPPAGSPCTNSVEPSALSHTVMRKCASAKSGSRSPPSRSSSRASPPKAPRKEKSGTDATSSHLVLGRNVHIWSSYRRAPSSAAYDTRCSPSAVKPRSTHSRSVARGASTKVATGLARRAGIAVKILFFAG